jgi:type IV pilus assembly protein PilN
MTATLEKTGTQLWSSMPGWGIAVNMLPPEIIAARRIRVIHKMLISALAVIVVLGLLGFGYAYWQVHSASSGLTAVQSQTTQLESQQVKYNPVLVLQAEIAHIAEELTTLTTNTVNLPHLVLQVAALAPHPGQLTKIDVEVLAAAPANTSGATPDNTGSLDSSGLPHIGVITVGGTVRSVADVAAYARALNALPGIVEVFPTSAQASTGGLSYTIEMTMTDQLLSGSVKVPTTPPSSTGGH